MAETLTPRISGVSTFAKCSCCGSTLAEIYRDSNDDCRGLRQGGDEEDWKITKLWFTECRHFVCSKHLEGGGAPFHPQGRLPRAVCPFCKHRYADMTEKTLYWVHGYAEGEYNKQIPKPYFEIRPDLYDASGGRDAATQFRYSKPIRYIMNEQDKPMARASTHRVQESRRLHLDRHTEFLELTMEALRRAREQLLSLGRDVAFIDAVLEPAHSSEADEAMPNPQLRWDPNDRTSTQSHHGTTAASHLALDTTINLGRPRRSFQTPEAQGQEFYPQPARAPIEPDGSPPKRRRILSTSGEEVQQGYEHDDVQIQRVHSRDLMPPPPIRLRRTTGTIRSTATGVSNSRFQSRPMSEFSNVLGSPESISSISPVSNARVPKIHESEEQGTSSLYSSFTTSQPVPSTATPPLLINPSHSMQGFSFRATQTTNSRFSTRPVDTPAERMVSAAIIDTPDRLGAWSSLYKLSGQARLDSEHQDLEHGLGHSFRWPLEHSEPRAQPSRLEQPFRAQASPRLRSGNRSSSASLEQQSAIHTGGRASHSNTSPARRNPHNHLGHQDHKESAPSQPLDTENFLDRFVLPNHESPQITRLPSRREPHLVHADGELDELRGQRISLSRSSSTANISPSRSSRISLPPPRTPARGRSPVRRTTGISSNIRSSANRRRTSIANRHRVPLGSSRSPSRNGAVSPYFAPSTSVDTLPLYAVRTPPFHTSWPLQPAEHPPTYVESNPRLPSTRPAFSNAYSFLPSFLRPASNRRAARR